MAGPINQEMQERRRELLRQRRARYRKSPKGRAAKVRYDKSPKGWATRARYQKSPKRRAAQARYQSRPEVKEHRLWMQRSRRRYWRLRETQI